MVVVVLVLESKGLYHKGLYIWGFKRSLIRGQNKNIDNHTTAELKLAGIVLKRPKMSRKRCSLIYKVRNSIRCIFINIFDP